MDAIVLPRSQEHNEGDTDVSAPKERNFSFPPDADTKYLVGLCRSDKTLALARALYLEHSINAWIPRIENNNPKKGEKRIRAAMPGFIFIDQRSAPQAQKLSDRLLVPTFRPLILNGTEHTCTHEELCQFRDSVNLSNSGKSSQDYQQLPDIQVGDHATINAGPFKGLTGTVVAVYVKGTVMVTVESDFCSAISLPAAFLS